MKSKFRSLLPILALAVLLAFGIGFFFGRNAQPVDSPPVVSAPETDQANDPVDAPTQKEETIDEKGYF
ncbi:MAG: hypothetical protein II153_06000, partial [Erysipelotrichaceae bacterium]|nr:hypothetical protein [Erysipelotrichaceae bacterium]